MLPQRSKLLHKYIFTLASCVPENLLAAEQVILGKSFRNGSAITYRGASISTTIMIPHVPNVAVVS